LIIVALEKLKSSQVLFYDHKGIKLEITKERNVYKQQKLGKKHAMHSGTYQ
jgi:hypothetical protein